jgi:hypothetical protein
MLYPLSTLQTCDAYIKALKQIGDRKTKKFVMDKSAAYCRYYQAQSGGEIPVFRGGRQNGEGLGDILRGIFRFIAPLALRGISKFAGHTLDAHQKGATLKEAAKSALTPTLDSVASGFAEQFQGGKNQQTGSGMALNQPGCKKAIMYVKPRRQNVYKRPKSKRRSDGKFAQDADSGTHYNF